ncbi:MAG: hypothetical protein CMQ20_01610 [Gammaproteobacteria bacterium]|jgi:hypothetical protein|nr:hypothetical protein [Gammaproteobacteria bacterium]|tara:strand:+ start:304 stop:957 length:654 start_codon:yes stop_codon:yes gene_type:complete
MEKKSVHEEVFKLLPWFTNESLEEKERDLVMAHLRECLECRKERDQLQRIEAIVKETDEVVSNYRFSYNKLLPRIEEAELARENAAGQNEEVKVRNWLPVAGIAASLMLAVGLIGVYQVGLAPQPIVPQAVATDFRTLTTQTQMVGETTRVALTFEQPVQAVTMRKALIETHSNIISGPDESGTYVIEVEIPPAMSGEEYLQSLRKIEGVRYARLGE